METGKLVLSDKYKVFLKHKAPVEFLEGTTSAGKTTVGLFKFMLRVAASPKKLHIIAAEDTGTAEKNLITKDLGILDDFGKLTEYKGNGSNEIKIPHIIFHTSGGDKIILIMGYGDKKRWKKALGGQYGCLLIDEINTADIEFIREASMRCDYLMGTLNPDDPGLPVYKEYINHSRPLPEYKDDAPIELNNMLVEEPKPGWVHWFFSFEHNLGVTPEKIAQIKLNTPKGTKLWKNKIQGLRGRATGLVFGIFDEQRHVVSKEYAQSLIQDKRNREQREWFEWFTSGLDTAYSQKSPDTIAMSFIGITNKGRCFLLDERVYNNANLGTPLAPSDTVINYIAFLERNRKEWGFAKNVFIDSADQATITEFEKYKRSHPECLYLFNNAYKRVEIIDRINLQLGWMAFDDEAGKYPVFLVVDTCKNYIGEMGTYSWKEDKDNTPEDGNDHMINSAQYGWIPFKDKIGVEKK
ncbi:MAG: terminase [Lachnospiraceae bacterium]|nr:terminase [Lachnospiraceae bacterium]